MALVWMDGFDWMSPMADDIDARYSLLKRYRAVDLAASSPDGQIVVGRDGSGSAVAMGHYSQSISTGNLNEADTGSNLIVLGYAFKTAAFHNSEALFEVWRAGQKAGYLEAYTSGNLQWFPNGAAFAGGIAQNSGWNYLEVRVLLQGTGGEIQVRVNGHQVYEKLAFDSTNASEGSGWTHLTVRGHGTTSAVDDLYICNGDGTENIDFLGDTRVMSLNPDGDYVTDWDQSGVGGHYEDIDNQPITSGGGGEPWTDASYIEDDVSSNQCLFDYTDIADDYATQAVVGLQVASVVRVTSPQMLTFKNIVKSVTTEETLCSKTVMWDDYWPEVSISELDPDTTDPWTIPGINAARFGVEVG